MFTATGLRTRGLAPPSMTVGGEVSVACGNALNLGVCRVLVVRRETRSECRSQHLGNPGGGASGAVGLDG
jgi:hypothetical protein